MFLLLFLLQGFRLNPVNASHQNRSLGDEQLDDGIVDTLVWALMLNERLPHFLQIEITAAVSLKANKEISDRIP